MVRGTRGSSGAERSLEAAALSRGGHNPADFPDRRPPRGVRTPKCSASPSQITTPSASSSCHNHHAAPVTLAVALLLPVGHAAFLPRTARSRGMAERGASSADQRPPDAAPAAATALISCSTSCTGPCRSYPHRAHLNPLPRASPARCSARRAARRSLSGIRGSVRAARDSLRRPQ